VQANVCTSKFQEARERGMGEALGDGVDVEVTAAVPVCEPVDDGVWVLVLDIVELPEAVFEGVIVEDPVVEGVFELVPVEEAVMEADGVMLAVIVCVGSGVPPIDPVIEAVFDGVPVWEDVWEGVIVCDAGVVGDDDWVRVCVDEKVIVEVLEGVDDWVPVEVEEGVLDAEIVCDPVAELETVGIQ
jgi:hypothetical protein